MDNIDIIKDFFANIRCSQCHSPFDKDSVKIVRQEYNYTVVKIICSKCEKNVGLVIVGLDKEPVKSNENIDTNLEELPFEFNNTPINYDDVIDAHNFFYNLDADWTKHLPKNL